MSKIKKGKRKAKRSKEPLPKKSRLSPVWLLALLLAAETVWGGWKVAERALRTAPPSVQIDPELMNIQDTFRDQVIPLQDKLVTAVRLDPSPQSWLDLGSLYVTTGYYPQAELCLREAQSLDPESADAAYALATTFDLLGRMEEAIGQYELATKTSKGRQLNACFYQIGKNYLRLERPELAEKAFREIYTFLPASYELVKIYTRQGKLDRAISEMRMLIHNRPRALETHFIASRIAEAQGRQAMAAKQRQLAETAVREVPFVPLQEFSEDFRERFPASESTAK